MAFLDPLVHLVTYPVTNGVLGTKHQPDPIMMNEGPSHRVLTFTTMPEGHPVKLLLLLALFALTSPMFSQNLAVVDVTVVDTQTGALTPHRTVLVRDGRIRSVDNAAPTKDTTVVPGRGKFLLPGRATVNAALYQTSPRDTWRR
jgi:hypothetical protein